MIVKYLDGTNVKATECDKMVMTGPKGTFKLYKDERDIGEVHWAYIYEVIE